MKLIDAEALKNKIMKTYLPADRLSAGVLFDLISTASPIDPIHAAGGCYCWECKSYNHGCCIVKRYLGDDSIIAMPPNGFCSYGKRREGVENE